MFNFMSNIFFWRDFRVDRGVMNDVTKHMKTAIHQASIKSQKSTPAATNFFVKSKLDQDEGNYIFFSSL